MRIIDDRCQRKCTELREVTTGTLVRFKHPFHQTNCWPDDAFMVCQVSGCYRPEKHRDKIGVTNCRNGNLSYVCGDRDVEILYGILRLVDKTDSDCNSG